MNNENENLCEKKTKKKDKNGRHMQKSMHSTCSNMHFWRNMKNM